MFLVCWDFIDFRHSIEEDGSEMDEEGSDQPGWGSSGEESISSRRLEESKEESIKQLSEAEVEEMREKLSKYLLLHTSKLEMGVYECLHKQKGVKLKPLLQQRILDLNYYDDVSMNLLFQIHQYSR